MKHLVSLLVVGLFIYSCGTTNKTAETKTLSLENEEEKAVVIENDSLDYKIIIVDLGFNTYLNSIARPASFYSQNYYENRNIFYVAEWNRRASDPTTYNGFYENRIDYTPNIDYGLDVNYKLFNYFKFVEHKYKVRF